MNEKAKPKKLLDQVRDVLRVKNYAYKTEKLMFSGFGILSSSRVKSILRIWAQNRSKNS